MAINSVNEKRLDTTKNKSVPVSQDLIYQAKQMFPGYDDNMAMTLYVMDKAARQQETDSHQNKLIQTQKSQNDKLTGAVRSLSQELQDFEQQSLETDREVERLKDLTTKLKPAGELQQQTAKASRKELEKLEAKLNSIKSVPGIDQQKFTELSKQVEQMKNYKSTDDKDIQKIEQLLSTLQGKSGASDQMFDKVMGQLEKTQQDLDAKEQRFQAYIEKKSGEVSGLKSKVSNIEKSGAEQLQTYQQKINDLDQSIENANNKAEELYTKAWSTQKKTGEQIKELNKASIAQDAILNNLLDLVAKLNPELQNKVTPALSKLQNISKRADQEISKQDPELQQALVPTSNIEPSDLSSVKDVLGKDQEQDFEYDSDKEYPADVQQHAQKATSDLLSQMKSRKGSLKEAQPGSTEMISAAEQAVATVYPLFIRKYPGIANSYTPEFIQKMLLSTIWTGLLVYIESPDFDESYIFNYMDKVFKRFQQIKPPAGTQPEFKVIDPVAPSTQGQLRESKTKRIINGFESYLDNLIKDI
jgi:chromosome segregation ATPase